MQHTAKQLLELTKANLNCDIRRQRFIIGFVLALIAVRTVNLTEIAVHMGGKSSQLMYRTIQRFFQHFRPESHIFLKFLLTLLPDEPLTLIMDRTNWDYGKVQINYLVIGVLYQGSVIPLCWLLLPKKGNSNQTERIALLRLLLTVLPISKVKVFIADREFVGRKWLSYLKSRAIKRCIRLKKNSLVFPNSKARNLWELFESLEIGDSRFMRRRYRIHGAWFYLAAVMLRDDLLVVACDDKPRAGLQAYGLRWGIETFFGNVKTRGFHLEDTHMTDGSKLALLLGLLALATLWALQVGEALQEAKGILKTKSHGRLEQSLFRVGLDFLRRIILQGSLEHRQNRLVLRVLTCT